MDSIRRAIEKLKSDPGKRIAPSGGGKFEGGGDIFAPDGEGQAKPAAPPTDDKDKGAQEQINVPESILIRFFDVDVLAGHSYEYRIRMRLSNPNYGKKDLVRRPDYAENKELLSEPSQVTFMDGDKPTSIVRVPVNTEIYAYYTDARDTRETKLDRAYVQVQSWMSHIRPDRTRPADMDTNAETVGDWMVEDISVGRGQPVFAVKAVKVPIWSAKDNSYHFMEFSSMKASQRLKGTFPIDVSAPQMLVDFEGGHSVTTIRGRGKESAREVSDDSGLELLFLGNDGKLRMRSYWQDMADARRFEREVTWTGWLKSVKDAADKEKDKDKSGDKNPFDKGGPGKQ
jgi:hypothetical protein